MALDKVLVWFVCVASCVGFWVWVFMTFTLGAIVGVVALMVLALAAWSLKDW